MPSLPTKVKTWEFDPNTVVGHATSLTAHRQQMLAMKNSMIDGGIFTTPWTVIGSSDATVSAMDGTDHWTVEDDLDFNSTLDAAHSWIVLEQSGIQFAGAANPLQLLITLNGGTFAAASVWRSFVLSPRNGFGSANGGTDGTHELDPTATDQWCPYWRTSWANSTATWVQTVMMTDDGKITRILIGNGTGPRLVQWLSFEVPKNPIAIWDQPFFFMAKGGGTGDAATVNKWGNQTTDLGSQPTGCRFQHAKPMINPVGVRDPGDEDLPGEFSRQHVARVGTTITQMSGAGEVTIRAATQIVHDVSGGYNICPANIYVRQSDPTDWYADIGARGSFWGEFEDFYWIGEDTSPGDALPASGTTKQWWCLGDIIVPGPADSATDISL